MGSSFKFIVFTKYLNTSFPFLYYNNYNFGLVLSLLYKKPTYYADFNLSCKLFVLYSLINYTLF